MGAVNFLHFLEATEAKDAYKKACEEAIYWQGHDPYNGTISTTDFVGVVERVAETWMPETKETAETIIAEKYDYGEKWECRALDCGATKGKNRMWALFGFAAC